jgi:hypothetical protein
VTVVACCRATGAIFNGFLFREKYKQDLLAGSEVAMTDFNIRKVPACHG